MTSASFSFRLGLLFPEGPVALPDGTWLVAEGGERGCVTQISTDGKKGALAAMTGLSNRLAVNAACLRTLGGLPTNVAFGLPGKKETLRNEYQLGQFEVFPVKTDGCFWK